ncbi:hypothetical protein CKO44_10250 [Rubrivivax gelatinosus]|nr:CvpA family protein [Rubrivivax gelatinosus]MBK1613849.1 hypothetical protein [Rubrivivax gelatinosus]
MNPVDLLLYTIVLLGALLGLRRGFVADAAALVALVASVAFALWAWPLPLTLAGTRGGAWAAPLAFVACLLLGRVLAGALLSPVVAAVPERTQRRALNRVGGLLPGALGGAVQAALAALLLLTLPLADRLTLAARDSRAAETLAAPAAALGERLAPIFEPAVDRSLQRLTVAPDSSETVALDFVVADAPQRPELEARMLELVNTERVAAGLGPLAADPALAAVAREHGRDMLARGYFAHLDPGGVTPFDRMRRAGLRFRAAGENLALAPTLALAHRGLMNSPGHRANILRAAFGRAGIAVLDAGRHGLVVTQNFRD